MLASPGKMVNSRNEVFCNIVYNMNAVVGRVLLCAFRFHNPGR